MTVPPPASRLPLALACGGSFLAFLDVTITNLAVPDLQGDLAGDVSTLAWVVTLYTVLFAGLLVPAGRIADVVGRRRLFAAGVALFTAASLLAAAAPSLAVLLLARAVQGVGAAAMIPASLAFVLTDTPPARRPMAIAVWSASASLAAVVGPALGGVLVDLVGWRALFCINLPAGVALLVLARRAADDGRRSAALPDPLGTGLIAFGVGLLVLGVTEGADWGWSAAPTLACLAVAALAVVVAVRRSRHHPAPAIPVDLWELRSYRTANIVSLLFGFSLYAWLLVGVLFLTGVWGYSALDAGLAMTPGAVVAMAAGMLAGRASLAPRVLVASGSIALGIAGLAGLAWLPATPHFLTWWIPVGALSGAAIGVISVGVSSAAALSVAPPRFATATGLNIAVRQVGGAIGVAVLAALLDGRDTSEVAPFLPIYGLSAAACLLTLIAARGLVLPPTPVAAPGPLAAADEAGTPLVGRAA